MFHDPDVNGPRKAGGNRRNYRIDAESIDQRFRRHALCHRCDALLSGEGQNLIGKRCDDDAEAIDEKMGKHSIKNTAGSFQKKGEGHAESEGIAELIEIQMEKAEDKAA